MRKILLSLMLLFAPACVFAAEAAEDKDDITGIEEKAGFEKGAYTAPADAQAGTINVKKGEGFDFKVPEILITGQVDTKVMLKREIISLEDLQSVRNVLYEKEKIYMPDYYLKEEALSPQTLDTPADRDFVGKLTLLAGSYSGFFADGVIGKAFDKNNRAVLRLTHENYANERTNDRDTYDNLNYADLYYSTRYDFIEAVYRVNCRFDRYGNPYPSNIFLNTLSLDEVSLGTSMTGTFAGIKGSASLGYLYFGMLNSASSYVYKESRFTAALSAERDFSTDIGSKIKVIASLNGYGGPQFMDGAERPSASVNLFTKAIMYFEPVVLQLGVK
ncbi:MAG: hypothetical protein LLG37_06715, partial [Spirochaetia bacterium]|nr:hypothetical protein [Spirochaetia bacterium]